MMCTLNSKRFFLSILWICWSSVVFCQTEIMKEIQFIPKEFHEVKLGYYEGMPNVCTPLGGADLGYMCPNNKIFINIPQKIICKDGVKPVIPVCGTYMITNRRKTKYAHSPARMLNIRRVGDDVWYSAAITNLDPGIVIPSFVSKREKKRIEREIQEAQKYSDEELDADTDAGGGDINVDLMDYVKIPITSGVYEIYMAFSGLESNRMQVEIVIENKADKQDAKPAEAESPIQSIEPKIEEELPEI